jgi:diguanylate cyclase (GGDEF)-like protein
MSLILKDQLGDQLSYESDVGNIVASLADILNLIPIGVQIDDPRHRTIYVNDSFTRMLGYTLADIAELDDWFRLAYPDPNNREWVRREWARHMAQLQAAGTEIPPLERVITCKNGEQKVMEFHVRRLGDHYIYLNIDVSARHHFAAEQRRLAITDALTGLANRRHFFERAEALLSLKQDPLATLIFDLDHFKAVNDGHGHAVGDAVLVEVAKRCRAVLDDMQLLARLGGEEFGVLLPACDEVEAAAVAERIRTAVSANPITLPAVTVGVTISIGGAFGMPDDLGIDTLMVRADRALYAAKRAGRNHARFCVA